MNCHNVAPLVGAWIEILEHVPKLQIWNVAPLVGAWIEISIGKAFEARGHGRSSCRSVD